MMKARAKGSPDWNLYKSCSIGISLKSPNHTGEALEAIVDWMNGKFEYCTIDLTDSLERINIAAQKGITEDEARREANALGDAWMRENSHILSNLRMPMSLLRWDHWHSESRKPELEKLKILFKHAVDNNPKFSEAVNEDVNHFYERRFGLNAHQINQEQRELSQRYLIEEMAGHSLLYSDYRCATIYPGRQQESFKMLRESAVPNVPKGLENSYYTRLVVYDPNKQSSAGSANDNPKSSVTERIVSGTQKVLTTISGNAGGAPTAVKSLLPFRNINAVAYSPL